MKLDVSNLRHFSRDDFRMLAALEQGSRNHDLVPSALAAALGGLKHGGAHKVLSSLLRNKLIAHEGTPYDGFRLTYPGYDFLALRTLLVRGAISGVGRQLGVGKESDIFLVRGGAAAAEALEAAAALARGGAGGGGGGDGGDGDGSGSGSGDEEGGGVPVLALKLHRLGRTSFRAIRRKRDYLGHRRSANWLFMSRLSALKEFAFMTALHDAGFPTPVPVGHNRHAVVMSLVPGITLSSVKSVADLGGRTPASVHDECMALVARLAGVGLIHADLNEHNLMIDVNTGKLTLIDFPQMISMDHLNARELFERDVGCLRVYFHRRFGFTTGEYPTWSAVVGGGRGEGAERLDVAIEASGFTRAHAEELEARRAAEGGEEEGEGEGEGAASDEEEGEEAVEAEEDGVGAAGAAGAGALPEGAPEFSTLAPHVLTGGEGGEGGEGEEAVAGASSSSGEDSDTLEDRRLAEAKAADPGVEAARFGRPPDGTRHRAGARRPRPPGGEAYLRGKGGDGGGGPATDEGASVGGSGGGPNLAAVRSAVRSGLDRAARKSALAAAGSSKAVTINKGRDSQRHAKEVAKDGGLDGW